VVIVALLFFKMENSKAEMAANKSFETRVSRRVAGVTNIHNQAEELIAQNEISRELVQHLQQKALPLHGVLRVQRAIAKHLSEQLWIEKIQVGASRGRGGVNAVPQIVVEVAAKELNGSDPGRDLSDFRSKLENDPIMAGVARVGMLARSSQDSAKRVGIAVDLVKGGD